jgi:hypothetical protein
MIIPPWLPISLSLFLFVLGLFREELRRFMKIVFTVPPNKIRSAWKASSLRGYRTELLMLKRLQGNAYELLLYVVMEVG